MTITSELEPGTGYVHFTEITDSNVMGETNICIFQPHMCFTTATTVRRDSEATSTAPAE